MTSLSQTVGSASFIVLRTNAVRVLIAIAVGSLVALPVRAACTGVVIATNPVTGLPEKVWQEHDGQDYEIKHAENISGSWTNETQLTFDGIDETCPALGFDTSGNTAVVWKSASSPTAIFYRARKSVGGAWVWQSAAVEVSDGTYAASAPYVVFDGGRAWVAWREAGSGGTVRVVAACGPGAEPWPTVFSRYLLATVYEPGNMYLDLNSENGKLWATWVTSATTLQYSVWNGSSGWSSPSSVTIQSGNVAAAKAEARQQVITQ